ncbi:YdhK family protein [Carnobacterium viridans]|uniref:DUF1541 domain-containing protein n=1 Tax=Carnobacterium viridans TaxID=174587 RepID=A0A1H0ZVV2_9LACT|nr:YdhK family protein [Carnobacterium viridans]UDE94449.1 YdhK family protein [Carnobacterium viridans]SDQ31371.1 Protein of unknown function [Carnobacterium viridans]
MNKKKIISGVITLSSLALLAACTPQDSGNQESVDTSEQSSTPTVENSSESDMMNESESMDDMGGMMHDDSGEIPEGLQEAENPTYTVGDTVTIQTDHMAGMEGATGTIVGAFDTVAYEVSYDPTNGGPREENHKWVIHEEIADAGEEPFEPGDEVTLEANHMEGMEGATATIDDAKSTTVYMIDYQPTTGGEEVENHKWVTDSELSAE